MKKSAKRKVITNMNRFNKPRSTSDNLFNGNYFRSNEEPEKEESKSIFIDADKSLDMGDDGLEIPSFMIKKDKDEEKKEKSLFITADGPNPEYDNLGIAFQKENKTAQTPAKAANTSPKTTEPSPDKLPDHSQENPIESRTEQIVAEQAAQTASENKGKDEIISASQVLVENKADETIDISKETIRTLSEEDIDGLYRALEDSESQSKDNEIDVDIENNNNTIGDEEIGILYEALNELEADADKEHEAKKNENDLSLDIVALEEALDEITAESKKESFLERWNRRRQMTPNERAAEDKKATNRRIHRLSQVLPFLVYPGAWEDEPSSQSSKTNKKEERAERPVKNTEIRESNQYDVPTKNREEPLTNEAESNPAILSEKDVIRSQGLTDKEKQSLDVAEKNLKMISAMAKNIPAEKITEDMKNDFNRSKLQISCYRAVDWFSQLSDEERDVRLKALVARYESENNSPELDEEEKQKYDHLENEVRNIKASPTAMIISPEQRPREVKDKFNEVGYYRVINWLNGLPNDQRNDALNLIKNRFSLSSNQSI